MRNKRQYQRFIRRLEVEFSSEDRHYRGISSNFSIGGLFVRTNHPFAPGTLIDMTIHLPVGGGVAYLKGKVKTALKTPVVSIKNGMGVEIVEKDTAFVDFMKTMSKEESLIEGTASENETPVRRDPPYGSTPGQQDFSLIVCSGCGVRNRVPLSRISQAMRCGKCGSPLSPPA